MSDSKQYYDSLLEEKDAVLSGMEDKLDVLRADLRELEQQVLDARELMQRATLTMTLTMPLRADIEKWLEATKPGQGGAK